MSDVNIVINDNVENITVNIDDSSPNIQQFYATLSIINSLSSKFIETAVEMDTLQDTLSSNWQEIYEIVDSGAIVADGGFF